MATKDVEEVGGLNALQNPEKKMVIGASFSGPSRCKWVYEVSLHQSWPLASVSLSLSALAGSEYSRAFNFSTNHLTWPLHPNSLLHLNRFQGILFLSACWSLNCNVLETELLSYRYAEKNATHMDSNSRKRPFSAPDTEELVSTTELQSCVGGSVRKKHVI